jgi:hypothetical protein
MYKDGQLLYDVKDESTLFYNARSREEVDQNPDEYRIATKKDFEDSPPRVYLTVDQAIDCLPDKKRVHTFLNPGGMLMGADWNRESCIETFNNYPDYIMIGGDMCRGMKHGLVVWRDNEPVFIEALEEKLKKYDIIPSFE